MGSERTVTNSSQAVTASLTLAAFGQTIASSGSSTSAYQFGATSGYRTEGDAGLTLVGCRFYDAQVGRFITRDTYLDQAPYAYCDGDPVNAVDPSGHINVTVGGVTVKAPPGSTVVVDNDGNITVIPPGKGTGGGSTGGGSTGGGSTGGGSTGGGSTGGGSTGNKGTGGSKIHVTVGVSRAPNGGVTKSVTVVFDL